MTIGIYEIYWEQEENLIYVGQSVNIEYRYSQHLAALSKGAHTNYKVQKAYDAYGLPKLYILQECEQSELDVLEIFWTNEFDSINNGLNIIEAGPGGGRGLGHSQSKYTKRQILGVFSLLYKTTLPYQSISNRLKISKYLVHNIASGLHHLWLKEEYPLQFSIMLENKIKRRSLNTKTLIRLGRAFPSIVSPEGNVYNITSIAEFCREHFPDNIDSARSSIGKVLKGVKPSHKGWKLKTFSL